MLIVGAYLSLLLAVGSGRLPVTALAAFAALPLHLSAVRGLWAHAVDPGSLRPAIEANLRGTLLHGALLAAGIAFAAG